MSEEQTESLNGNATNPTPFEEFVRQQFEMLSNRMTALETGFGSLQTEMAERFLQLSRQIRELDQKVDIFIKEQIYIKDDIRELREARLPKN
jgi:hypothetical protein